MAPGARPSLRVAGGTLPPETPASLRTVVDWGPFPERDEDHGDYKVADAAIAQIRNMPRDRPFFLAVGFSLPHVPVFAPQKWFDRIPAGTATLPPIRRGDRDDTPPFSWLRRFARRPSATATGKTWKRGSSSREGRRH